MKEEDVGKTRSGSLKTQKAGKKLRFIGPPSPIVGSDNARLRVRLSQPAALKLEYGSVEGDGPLRTIPIVYTDSTVTEELLTEHDITWQISSQQTAIDFDCKHTIPMTH